MRECTAYDVPSLRLDIACAYAFENSHDLTLQRIEGALASPHRGAVIDALEAMDMVSRRSGSDRDKNDLVRLLVAAGHVVRCGRPAILGMTMTAVGDVVQRHPWAFVGNVESSVLAGLGSLVTETAVGEEHREHVDPGWGDYDVAKRLIVRQAGARLAYRLFEHYRAHDGTLPDVIEAWRTVCGSNTEFLEVRNEWLAP